MTPAEMLGRAEEQAARIIARSWWLWFASGAACGAAALHVFGRMT